MPRSKPKPPKPVDATDADDTKFAGAGEIFLKCCDCLDGMAELPPSSVDVIVTSPPYNLGIAYSRYADNLPRAEYLDWTVRWIRAARRVLKPDGSLFLNIGASPTDPYLPHEVILAVRELLMLQNTLHWIKSITVHDASGEPLSAGHFKPINSPRFITDCHEFVFHLTHQADVKVNRRAVGVPYTHKSNIGRWKHTGGEDLRCRGNNWFIPYETISSRDRERPHPATFPSRLAEHCIRLHGSPPGKTTVLDPFVGIGNAALGALAVGVKRFIGFDIDPSYLTTAAERLPVTAICDLSKCPPGKPRAPKKRGRPPGRNAPTKKSS